MTVGSNRVYHPTGRWEALGMTSSRQISYRKNFLSNLTSKAESTQPVLGRRKIINLRDKPACNRWDCAINFTLLQRFQYPVDH